MWHGKALVHSFYEPEELPAYSEKDGPKYRQDILPPTMLKLRKVKHRAERHSHS